MATFTEIVAAVVVHSSAAAYSHFGVTLEPVKIEAPTPAAERMGAERVIARTPRKPDAVAASPEQPQHAACVVPIRA